MKDYSYSELKDMQERAMERVRAMQQRANETVTAAGNDLLKTNEQQYHDGEPQKGERPHHIKMPTNMPPRDSSSYQPFSDYFTKPQSNVSQKQSHNENKSSPPAEHGHSLLSGNPILESLMNEPDRAMLLPLLLLLRADGADEALMMSLLYIMS